MNLVKRISSGIVVVLITISVMKYNNPYYFLFLGLIGSVMAWEWEKMIKKQSSGFSVMMAGVTGMSILLFNIDILFFSLILVFIATLISYIYLRHKKEEKACVLSFGYVYINIPLISLSLIMMFYEGIGNFGFLASLWLFLTVWSSDTGGFLFGSLLKGPKLAPKITPKKRWSGFFGGIILAVGVSALYIYLKPDLVMVLSGYIISPEVAPSYLNYYFLGFTALTSIVSQLGDLFESFIKRKQDVKDSSDLIPGHGGVLDRFDGLMFASTFSAIAMIIWFS